MNTLSWLLYLAGVAGNIAGFLAIIVLALAILQLGIVIAYAIEKEMLPPRRLWISGAVAVILGIIASIIPNKETIMYIAASEYGEKVVNSKEVRDLANPATELLKTWMKKETERLAKEIKDK